MLFGRKTPPAAPKPDSVAATPAPVARPAEPATTLSPLASLATPAPSAPQPASAPAPAGGMSAALAAAQPPSSAPTPSVKGPEMNSSSPKPPTVPSLPGAGFKTDVPRRTVDVPGVSPRQPAGLGNPSAPLGAPLGAPAAAPLAPLPEQRRLIVGRDISLSGEIGSCDVLVVEGTVEAKLREGRSIEIADGGLFKGSVEIDEADIGGRFEGDIAVRGRLTVRSTGKITGSIKYGELAVEAGGQLRGDIQIYSAAPNAAAPAPTSAPAPAPVEIPVAVPADAI
ncbi:cytoskeletal protein CcmA (bactofilin family) [Azospirillum agricola]|uniref:bactofilin family protein n=1 Tax=Azospirillum agricola TaxID=1720247 RepID=UPI001AE7D7BA|nr:polymer-forming cytoskeletal protein [Azospirillum agricola]MBP2229787.1 cytoskeletal protein CcmA (bactofilin family) [Azospirillum agricola]